MKSTSGGVIMWRGQCRKAWSTSQSALALSSGEAEVYALTKVAVQLSGVISMAKDNWRELDRSCEIILQHCRHVKVQYLLTQSKIKDVDSE